MEQIKPLLVNGFKISYSINPDGLHVVVMKPGRLVTAGSRKVQSRQSTEYAVSALKAWEKIGAFNEYAKQQNQKSA